MFYSYPISGINIFQGWVCYFLQIMGYRGKEISHFPANEEYLKQRENSTNKIFSLWSGARIKYASP